MCGIRRPIRIRIMWRDNLKPSARFSDPVQLVYEPQHIGDMLDHVATDYFVELVVIEGIGKDSQVMYEVCLSPWIRIDTDGAGKFILPASYIQDFSRGVGYGSGVAVELTHRWGLVGIGAQEKTG